MLYRDFVVYGVDPDTGRLFLHAFNTDGSIDRAHAVDSPSGKSVFEGTVYGSTRFRDYRNALTRVNDRHLGVLIEPKNDGKYEKYSEKTYVRSSEKMAVLQ